MISLVNIATNVMEIEIDIIGVRILGLRKIDKWDRAGSSRLGRLWRFSGTQLRIDLILMI